MKNDFSKHWVSSISPKKQRKYRRNADLNSKRKMLSVHLSKELREKYKTRNLPVRKGDAVIVMRGKFAGTEGKIDRVYTKQLKVTLDSVKAMTRKGNKVPFKFRPSSLLIKELNVSDNWRAKRLENYGKAR
jgi:large subunit ribosomal protein L24